MNRTDDHLPVLRRVLGALQADGPGALHFCGQRVTRPVVANGSAGRNDAVDVLQQLLYTYAYTRPFSDEFKPIKDAEPDAQWIGRLLAANASSDRWDTGWLVQSVLPNGAVLAAKGRRQRVLPPGQFASHQSYGDQLAPGAGVSAYVAGGSFTLQDGFYYIFGEYLPDARQEQNPLRLYVNVDTEHASSWIRVATSALNRYHVPFKLKVLTAPEQMARTDGLVLFLHRRFLHITSALLTEGMQHLQTGSPLFALPLAPGLALAEDPGTGDSFGLHRCGLVSRAIWSVYGGQELAVEDGMKAIRAALEDRGLDWQRPYLNPGSTLWQEIPQLELRSEEEAA